LIPRTEVPREHPGRIRRPLLLPRQDPAIETPEPRDPILSLWRVSSKSPVRLVEDLEQRAPRAVRSSGRGASASHRTSSARIVPAKKRIKPEVIAHVDAADPRSVMVPVLPARQSR
jgi:hypothetical protein